MRRFTIFLLIHLSLNSFSQGKDFTQIVLNEKTFVKDQEETGSCWAYAACSYLESELLRIDKVEFDLSEAFLVYHVYLDKAQNYFLRQSKTNFATGALSHNAIKILNEKGVVPENDYQGKYLKDGANDYFEMHDTLESYLKSLLKIKYPSKHWLKHFEDILISYLGDVPEQFEFNERVIAPVDFIRNSGIEPQNYVSIT
jgi:bleomycin hydrolase